MRLPSCRRDYHKKSMPTTTPRAVIARTWCSLLATACFVCTIISALSPGYVITKVGGRGRLSTTSSAGLPSTPFHGVVRFASEGVGAEVGAEDGAVAASSSSATTTLEANPQATAVASVGTTATNNNIDDSNAVEILKRRLLDLSDRTDRGFKASRDDRREAGRIIYDLARFNPSVEPARDYYGDDDSSSSSSSRAKEPPPEGSDYSLGDNANDVNASVGGGTISGKWTLIYTDAPDIIGLDGGSDLPLFGTVLSPAKLGRIGQECSPPYIRNVIEWVRPDWADGWPFSGSDRSRILQRVVTTGVATPRKPFLVDLKVAGLELGTPSSSSSSFDEEGKDDLWTRFQRDGLPAGWLSMNPIDLKGPFNPPLGQFEILYLDDDLRMIRTSQNFLAVNRRIKRPEDEWF
jgi:hypothetical protein